MKIAIAGAGLGGLTAAYGLRRAGHEVTVFEKHQDSATTRGYRMRIDARAADVLGRVLPPELWIALLASASGSNGVRRRRFTDPRLRVIASDDTHMAGALFIGPGPLYRLLGQGLRPSVHWGAPVEDFAATADGTTVRLADGRCESADLLIIAEGVHSRLRRRLTAVRGDAPSGFAAIAGRVGGRAGERGLPRIAELTRDGIVMASGPHRTGLFVATHDPALGTLVDPAVAVAPPAQPEDAYLVWCVITAAPNVPADADPEALRAAAGRLLQGWHPEAAALVAAPSDPPVNQFALYVSPPVPSWPTTTATMLGDALHPIPPTGGIGGSTAIRDAGALVDALTGITTRAELLPAVQRYEDEVRGYADTVVADSAWPLAVQGRIARPAVHQTVTTALRAARAVRSVPRPLARR